MDTNQEESKNVIEFTMKELKEEFGDLPLDELSKRLGFENQRVVFFGFKGDLKDTYSVVETSRVDEVKMKCLSLSDSVNPTFHTVHEFFKFYIETPGTFKDMKIDDALAHLRVYGNTSISEDIHEPEVDEFDDDCTEDCRPGEHACGKK